MKPRPERALVERIIREEARAVRANAEDVVNLARYGNAILARRRAVRRIVAETGCTAKALADVWGCGRAAIEAALHDQPRGGASPKPKPPGGYDARTVERLTWAHGPERAGEIVAGRDAATQADIASWRRLAGAEA